MEYKKNFFKVGGPFKIGGKTKQKSSSSSCNRNSQDYDHGFGGSCPSLDALPMSTADVKEMFEKLLDDMNLTEEKKAPLRAKDTDFKRHMLTMQARGSLKIRGAELDTPRDFVHELLNSELKSQRRVQVLEALKVSLTSKPVSWVMEFGAKGLDAILRNMNYCCDNMQERRSTYECVRCLKTFMNNAFGLRRILEHEEALTILSRTVDPGDPQTMLEAVRCLGAICLVPPNGLEKVMEGLTVSGEIMGQERFLPIIYGLRMHENPAMQVACIQLVNAIISTPDDLDFRMHLRNEFMRTGLNEIIGWLSVQEDEELKMHVHIFHEHKEEDLEGFYHRYDNIRIELEDPHACFGLILNTVKNTVAEPYFISILQHLLAIRDDLYARPQYYKLIEECITQIVLHRNGYDPDFSATKRFQIDVEPLLNTLTGSSKFEDSRADISLADLTVKLDTALMAKQEAEAKAISLEGKVKQFTLELSQLKEGMKQNISDNINKVLTKSPSRGGSHAGQTPPPAPPLPPSSGPPPPPPLPGMGGPLLPPGAAPPLSGMLCVSPPCSQLPFGMAPRKKYSTNTQTKRLNWNKVNPKNLEKSSVWVNINEEEFECSDIFTSLEEIFSAKAPPKKVSVALENRPARKGKELRVLDIKSGQNLSILLSSMRLSFEEIKCRILAVDEESLTPGMLEQLVKSMPPPESLRKLAELRDCYSDLAEPEQFMIVMTSIKRVVPRLNSILFKMRFPELVADIKPDLVSTTEALDEIKNSRKFARLLELLLVMGNYLNAGSRNAQSVGFDISFLAKLENTKSQDGSMTLMHFLAQILENRHPDILGFLDETIHMDKAARVSPEATQKNIAFMGRQLKDLELDIRNLGKSNDPQDKFADVMKFQAYNQTFKTKGSLRPEPLRLYDGFQYQENPVKRLPTSPVPDSTVLAPSQPQRSFYREAAQHHELLSAMHKKLEVLYESTAKYFAFDVKKYTMEEFFCDVKTFKDGLQKALKENAKLRETQEKIKRASEAKEKSEKEKREKKLRQDAILNMTADENQEGIMDSLMEILKTGSAFTVGREPREGKHRTPRAAGANRRAQLSKNQSKQSQLESSILKEINFDDSSNVNRENVKSKGQRRHLKDDESEAEKLLKRLKAL